MSFAQDLVACEAPLRRYAQSLTKSRSRADDLVQDTFLLALRKEALFTPGTSLRQWLFTIMRNKFITDHRSSTRHSELNHEYQAGFPRSVRPCQEAQVMARESMEVAERELSEGELETIMVFVRDEMTYTEATAALGLAEGTIKSRLSRARARLRSVAGFEEKAR